MSQKFILIADEISSISALTQRCFVVSGHRVSPTLETIAVTALISIFNKARQQPSIRKRDLYSEPEIVQSFHGDLIQCSWFAVGEESPQKSYANSLLNEGL